MAATAMPSGSATVDEAEVDALLRAGREVVGPARQDGAAAQVQSGAARLYPRPGGGRISTAIPRSSTASRACASSTSAAAAGSCRSRWRGSARPWSAPTRPAANIEVAKRHAAQSDLRDRLPLHHGRGAGRRGRALRHRARDGGGRARRRRAAVRAALRRDGEARRADDRRHPQPHAEELRARHRRRRIRPALAAARHPSLGQVRHAERARDRDGAGAACASPTSAA